MKYVLVLLIFTLSCEEDNLIVEDTRTPCEKALDHILVCVGYRPYLASCDVENAEKILSTPCESIKDLWR